MVILTDDNIVQGASGLIFSREKRYARCGVKNLIVHDDGLIELDLLQPMVAPLEGKY